MKEWIKQETDKMKKYEKWKYFYLRRYIIIKLKYRYNCISTIKNISYYYIDINILMLYT